MIYTLNGRVYDSQMIELFIVKPKPICRVLKMDWTPKMARKQVNNGVGNLITNGTPKGVTRGKFEGDVSFTLAKDEAVKFKQTMMPIGGYFTDQPIWVFITYHARPDILTEEFKIYLDENKMSFDSDSDDELVEEFSGGLLSIPKGSFNGMAILAKTDRFL